MESKAVNIIETLSTSSHATVPATSSKQIWGQNISNFIKWKLEILLTYFPDCIEDCLIHNKLQMMTGEEDSLSQTHKRAEGEMECFFY